MKRKTVLLLLIVTATTTLSGCGYINSAKPVSLLSSCALDMIDGAVSTSPRNFATSVNPPDLVLRGWMANNLSGRSPEKITVVIANDMGEILASNSASGLSRPDVAEFFRKPNMRDSGFEILMQNVTKPGIYTVTIQGEFDGDTLICSVANTLAVTN